MIEHLLQNMLSTCRCFSVEYWSCPTGGQPQGSWSVTLHKPHLVRDHCSFTFLQDITNVHRSCQDDRSCLLFSPSLSLIPSPPVNLISITVILWLIHLFVGKIWTCNDWIIVGLEHRDKYWFCIVRKVEFNSCRRMTFLHCVLSNVSECFQQILSRPRLHCQS